MNLTDNQKQAVLSTDFNVLVSAGAGSGKTFVLVERYIEILRKSPDTKVSQIIAVTYTRKAAEEMRQRLKAKLTELANTSTGALQERWKTCLYGIDQAQISTIHSLCESILKTFPSEAAIDPHFEILDDLERANLINQSVDEVLLDEIGKQSVEHFLLLDYPAEDIKFWLETCIKTISEFREAKNKLHDALSEGFNKFNSYISKTIEIFLETELNLFLTSTFVKNSIAFLESNSCPPDNLLEPIRQNFLRILSEASADIQSTNSNKETLWKLHGLLKELSETKIGNIGGNKGNSKEIRSTLSELKKRTEKLINKVPQSVGPADEKAWRVIRSLVYLADRVISVYSQKKIQKQKLDYDDLIEKTYRLLCESNSPAKIYFNEHLSAILVDEFQDTNNIQASLLYRLAGPKTRLFLIGDDKQSIYKFQGADIRIFNQWKAHLSNLNKNNSQDVELGGEGMLLDLDQSFRSHTSLVSLINSIFYRIFEKRDEKESFKANYQALQTARTDSPNEIRTDVLIYSAKGESEKRNSEQSRRSEAELVAHWIKEKVELETTIFDQSINNFRHIQYSDFAVLLQVNSQFKLIELALSAAGIPYISVSGTGLLHTAEIIDLENILRWSLSSDDDHSLLGILRSPMFGVSDDLIHELLMQESDMPTLWLRIQKAAAENNSQYGLLKKVVYMLSKIQKASYTQSTDELLRTVISLTGYDIMLSALPHGHQRSRNVWKFTKLAAEHNQLSIREFLQSLKAMRQLKVEQTNAPLAADNSVKIMTIHKAKGLEFVAVALPFLDYKFKPLTSKFAFNKEYGIVFNTARSADDEKPQYFQLASIIENRMEDEERKRLLYVAMTRAKDYLGLFLDKDSRNDNSFRKLLLPALQVDEIEGQSDGTCSIEVANKEATFNVKVFDHEKLKNIRPQPLNPSVEESVSSSLSLIDYSPDSQVSFINKEVNWHDLLRVTPGALEIELHQSIIGTYFHSLMQNLPEPIHNRLSANELISPSQLRIVNSQVSKKLLADGDKLLNIFYKSKLFALLSKAKERFHETTYFVFDENKGIIDKRPDLIFQDEAGDWHIVDFKTDQVEEVNLEKQAQLHQKQLLKYQSDFELLCNSKAQAWLYFAQLGILHKVSNVSLSAPPN